ncbi:hypothetical protein Tco_0412888 [Tanacetum coccineum]
MSSSNQQTLVESRATDRPPILKKGNYIPWESQFRRFLENKEEDGERTWYLITKGPYVRPMITDPDDPQNEIPEPISKMTKANRNAGRQNMNQATNARNGQVQQIVESRYAYDCPKPKVCDAKYFREQMMLVMKNEAGGTLNEEENDFMLDNAYGDETLKELTRLSVREVENQQRLNIELKNKKELLQKELETYMECVKTLEFKSAQCLKYKETCDDLEREIQPDKDTIERILKEKDKIERDFFKSENEKVIIQHETQLAKKDFKARENSYLEDIVDLNDKLSSHDRIVYKMGQSIQTIHMLGKRSKKVYDPFIKAGLGYQNPERLKKAIEAQPEMYDGERLHRRKLIIDSPNSKETL